MLGIKKISEISSRKFERNYGPWRINEDNLTIYHSLYHPQDAYEIDLEEIKTEENILDWIYHISEKTTISSQLVLPLVWAFRDIFDFKFKEKNKVQLKARLKQIKKEQSR